NSTTSTGGSEDQRLYAASGCCKSRGDGHVGFAVANIEHIRTGPRENKPDRVLRNGRHFRYFDYFTAAPNCGVSAGTIRGSQRPNRNSRNCKRSTQRPDSARCPHHDSFTFVEI